VSTATKPRLSWGKLLELEPRLQRLYDEARAVRDNKRDRYFCANERWYRDFKPRLVNLVGWDRGDDANPAIQEWSREVDEIARANGGAIDSGLLPPLPQHVVPDGEDARLHGHAAYDLAYRTIYEELPACRNCMCFPATLR
jgi:hypothetical protein